MVKINLDEFYEDSVPVELDFGSDGESEEFLKTIDEAAKKAHFVSRGEFVRHALRLFMQENPLPEPTESTDEPKTE